MLFSKYFDMSIDVLINLGTALLIVAVGILILKLIVHFFRKAMARTEVDPSLVKFFVRCIRVTAYIIIAISALTKLGVSTTGLIAGFSAAAAGAALAVKDCLSDIMSGIVILFTRPFVTGDFIEFDTYKGYVTKIDLMHTNILTYDNTTVVIPNSKVTANNLNNYTANTLIRVQIPVPIGYDADIDKAKSVILKAISGTENIVTDVEKFTPVVRVESFEESSILLMTRVWTEFQNYWQVYYANMESIKKSLDENDIPIPFNQLDVHITK